MSVIQRGCRDEAFRPRRTKRLKTRKQRLPAWTNWVGPTLYIVRTTDGEFFAGFTTGGTYPPDWPEVSELERLFRSDASGDGVLKFEGGVSATMADALRRIFAAWERGKGALLYGPPGTGKTRLMSQVYSLLQDGDDNLGLQLDPEDASSPFRLTGGKAPIPVPVAIDWLTFHQNYSYEDFILGLRPSPSPEGLRLQPRMGRLLDLLFRVWSDSEDAAAAVLFIDEINRGNAARIFGEFITFLDMDYRDTSSDGTENDMRLPVPLPSLNLEDDGRTETLERPGGGAARLPSPWYFPRHLFAVASMNSVDRAAIPLDSALARRFDRIELRPDLDLLASKLGLDRGTLDERAKAAREAVPAEGTPPWRTLSAEECTVLLLDRINAELAAEFGSEFELGHGLVWRVVESDEAERWETLLLCWDEELFPQLQDRYAGRTEQLLRLLGVDADPMPEYLFRERRRIGGVEAEGRSLERVDLAQAADSEAARNSLRWLATH